MNSSQSTLYEILQRDQNKDATETHLDKLSSAELAHVYVNSAYLSTACEYLREQFWLKKRREPNAIFEELLDVALSNDIAQVGFLKDIILSYGPADLKKLLKLAGSAEALSISNIISRSFPDQKEFLIEALKSMKQIFIQEEQLQEGRGSDLGHSGPCLYRTFDGLDLVFKLDYQLDKDMVVDHVTKERLYQTSGVGVQSGYSTILLALNHSELTDGKVLVDLGSGYGRIGLVGALLWPKVNFVGYEYVPHRVEVSNNVSNNLELELCKFFTQDLSLPNFNVPDADIYYLYDPFSEETYKYVLDQIVEISKRKKITIVTKGNARSWLTKISEELSWPVPILIDEGNLCIFKTTI